MGKRRRVGIIFRNYSHWTGGINYIVNLVCSINILSDDKKPLLVIYTTSKEDFEIIEKTGYPYLRFKNMNVYAASKYVHFFNRITNKINGKRWLVKYFSPREVDFIFPYPAEEVFKKFKNIVSWIPDFQEFYYPQFFTSEEIKTRSQEHLDISKSSRVIIFSSEDALKDFNNFYPFVETKKKVINFAVSNYNIKAYTRDELIAKFGISGNYYISPNQFWTHKNHKVIIEAVNLLKQEGLDILMIFTGKEHDYRNPNYINELKDLVVANKLGDNIKFLGFVDKIELISLIKNSVAVIQPSLSEGWSTVIEDAKALNKFVIASSINVHREQLKNNAVFFKPSDATELANYLRYYISRPPIIDSMDYSPNIRKFGESFIDILEDFT